MSPAGLGTKNDCADEDQQQFTRQGRAKNRRCNKRTAYTERPTFPLVEEEAPFLNKYVHVQERTKILTIDVDET
jgi:hypothetical protein